MYTHIYWSRWELFFSFRLMCNFFHSGLIQYETIIIYYSVIIIFLSAYKTGIEEPCGVFHYVL